MLDLARLRQQTWAHSSHTCDQERYTFITVTGGINTDGEMKSGGGESQKTRIFIKKTTTTTPALPVDKGWEKKPTPGNVVFKII